MISAEKIETEELTFLMSYFIWLNFLFEGSIDLLVSRALRIAAVKPSRASCDPMIGRLCLTIVDTVSKGSGG